MTTGNSNSPADEKRQDIRFAEKDEALRKDVHALGMMVGELLLEQGGEALFKTVESARRYAIARREGDAEAGQKLSRLLSKMSSASARDVVRAFSTYFQVVNNAEQVHRIRRRRDYLKDTSIRQPRSLDATLSQLREAGFGPESATELLEKIQIEPVFTPHPTETTRRTILRKHQNIVRRMVDIQNPALTPQEINACQENIRADITAIWQTEENPDSDATIFDELEHTLFFFTDVIYRVIPPFYEALEMAYAEAYEEADPFKAPNMLRFASWIGGDISTNQEISARTIRETLARQRSLILNLYYQDCQRLAEKLSQSVTRIDVNKSIKERIESYAKQFPGAQGSTPHRYKDMPYRVLLRLMCERLQATYDETAFPYESADQFIDDLKLIAASLKRRKGSHAGLFDIKRLIRRAETFGFRFLSLDLRCDSAELQKVVGYCLGEHNWLKQSAGRRTTRLVQVLEVNDSPTIEPDNNAKRLFSIFRAITFCRRKYGERAIGLLLVRHCKGIDDILAVLLLARWSGMYGPEGSVPLDVAPAFETDKELATAGELISRLLKNELYTNNLKIRGAHQTVMLSTSGARTDSCIAASRWGTQQAHNELSKIFADAEIDFTLFHGRGSFSGRGGVADSIACGHLRATEHGESVNERYGVRGIAFRTLEKAFSAVTTATAGMETKFDADPEWLNIMNTVAVRGNESYLQLVGQNNGFSGYFRLATPIDVIELSRRNSLLTSDTDDETLQHNIPWAFAWAQSRFLLPSWFGFGAGIHAAIDEFGIDTLRKMAGRWSFFKRLLYDTETSLAIADLGIAHHYSMLAGDDLHQRFFSVVETEFDSSVQAVLQLREQDKLLATNNTLRRSIRLRNPYVDPMSLLQVELLQRWRAGNREDDKLLKALLASVSGISRGLQTSV